MLDSGSDATLVNQASVSKLNLGEHFKKLKKLNENQLNFKFLEFLTLFIKQILIPMQWTTVTFNIIFSKFYPLKIMTPTLIMKT